ncbi:RNA polymerase sigma factor [Paenibacillus sp. CAA11]|uniref:RNA polymerase sigma factor n=1 Tax=Paenibacillus sp. CAA11 TaxID=1532905 RepID=UPI00131EE0CF|nr:sigma-70 family RNA polymerase sigma factor [Paenibacillus sp. CAA11]
MDTDNKDFITDLYIQYYPLMKKIAYNVCREYSVVDDLVNEAFIKIFNKTSVIKSLETGQRASYLVSTIRNVSLNYLRHRSITTSKVLPDFTDDHAASIPEDKLSIEDYYSIKEQVNELIAGIGSLSERDQKLLYLKYYYELNAREIGDIMNLPANHVREYIVRARHRAMKVSRRHG